MSTGRLLGLALAHVVTVVALLIGAHTVAVRSAVTGAKPFPMHSPSGSANEKATAEGGLSA